MNIHAENASPRARLRRECTQSAQPFVQRRRPLRRGSRGRSRRLQTTANSISRGIAARPAMVVRIRLARFGVRNDPHYRINVAHSFARRDGKFLEHLGVYHPRPDNPAHGSAKRVSLNFERARHWLSLGAEPTKRVEFLLGLVRCSLAGVLTRRRAFCPWSPGPRCRRLPPGNLSTRARASRPRRAARSLRNAPSMPHVCGSARDAPIHPLRGLADVCIYTPLPLPVEPTQPRPSKPFRRNRVPSASARLFALFTLPMRG